MTATVALTVVAAWALAALAAPPFLDALSKLSPLATGLLAVFALIVGISTIRQKQGADAESAEADRRDQWWKRAQWAIDRLFEAPEERQVVAWRILRVLAESSLAGPEELAVFDAVGADGLTRFQPSESDGIDDPILGDTGGEQEGRRHV
ncbi:MAG TPA: hypothetical protein VIU11_25650 [Nakamurella sp.]